MNLHVKMLEGMYERPWADLVYQHPGTARNKV